jgi:hypothetical protein
MRVDRRHHVRDLARTTTLFGALGLNSTTYAQGGSSWIYREAVQ